MSPGRRDGREEREPGDLPPPAQHGGPRGKGTPLKSRELPRRGQAALIVLLALAFAWLAAACATVSQDAPAADEPAAALVVTARFGEETLLEQTVPPDQSVLAATRGATPVETSFGGGFLAGMLDRESDAARRRDWFYWVDGILGEVGAGDRDLLEGEEAWWDYRGWSALADVWAVVGQWPAPFVSARAPERPVYADAPLREALVELGAEVTDDTGADFRVRVGSDEELRDSDAAWADAVASPDAAGLAGAIESGAVTLLGPDGAGREPVPGARALAVATPTGLSQQDGVLLAVVGLDRAAAEAAAETIARDPEVLRLRFAVVFDREGEPIGAAGRGGR